MREDGYFYQNICNLGPFYEVRENAHLQMMVGTHRIIGLSDIWIISVSDWRRFFVPFRTHERFINRHLKSKKKSNILTDFTCIRIYSHISSLNIFKKVLPEHADHQCFPVLVQIRLPGTIVFPNQQLQLRPSTKIQVRHFRNRDLKFENNIYISYGTVVRDFESEAKTR